MCAFLLSGVLATRSNAQVNPDAKWIPAPASRLGTGYYVVDSYDNVPPPWLPSLNFVDTTFQPFLWHRVQNGPRSFVPSTNYVAYWQVTRNDSVDNTFCGPLPIGFRFNFYGNNYDSVYLSSNGYIGFGNWNRATGGDGPAFSAGGGGWNPPNGVPSLPSTYVPKATACFMATDGMLVHGKYDSSKVLYKTNLSTDTMFINFYGYYAKNGSMTSGYIDKFYINIQICLTRQDSSITFTYLQLHGAVTIGLAATRADQLFENGGFGVSPPYESIIGVQDSTQTQGTTYMGGGYINDVVAGPRPNQAGQANAYYLQNGAVVKFRRWPNICQADTIVWPPRNYELLVGDSLTPIATFGNVAPTPQTFYTIFRIRNLITGQTVYQSQDSVLNLGSLKTQRDTFLTYYTYPGFSEQVGSMFAEAIASPYKNVDQFIGDYWPFDDTLREEIFVIQQLSAPFYDFNDNFSTPALLPGTIPNALQWVNINSNVVDGEQYTFSPPPPRGLEGDTSFPQLNSPVILMDRRDANGNYYPACNFGGGVPIPPFPSIPPPVYPNATIGQGGYGDTIISFPIDLSATNHALFGFSYERAGTHTYPRWYDVSQAVGPERTILYPDGSSVARVGDSLTVEYANYTQITNVGSWFEKWAGDGGKDLNFNRVYLPIDSPFTWKYFRFRVRLKAKNDFEPGSPGDDADAWYVDNFVVSTPLKPELEVSFVRVSSAYPYLRVPTTQASAIPLEVGLGNNGGGVAQSFGIEVQIWPQPPGSYRINGTPWTVYDRLITEQSVNPGQTAVVTAPSFNAGVQPPGTYQITARLRPQNYDAVNENDSTYSMYSSTFDSSYVYDTGTNDVPSLYGLAGVGLKMQETSADNMVGGSGTAGTGSGTIATKFVVYTRDTIYGVQAYFGSYNQANDPIRIALYRNSGLIPGDTLPIACATTQTFRQGPWDAYSTYLFNCGPIILTPGAYWLGVSQMAETGMELGGNSSRSSVDWTVYDCSPQEQEGFVLNYPGVDSAFAFENTALSRNWYPFYFPAGRSLPGYSYPITTGLKNNGPASNVNSIDCGKIYQYFFGEGSWIPMIRPYFRWRQPATGYTPDPPPPVPIELLTFSGAYSGNEVALAWKTASELNNNGFFVQRTVKGENSWTTLNANQIIPGFGTTSAEHNYDYNDPNVTLGTTYQYRLQQVDNDGGVTYSKNIVEITIPAADYMLYSNYPNPFNASTQIAYSLPASGFLTLKVYDMLGREVKTLVNSTQQSTKQPVNVSWDGTDNNGAPVASGNYMYKMEVNGRTFSHSLSLTR